MNTLYVVMVKDHHTDPQAHLFTNRQTAINLAVTLGDGEIDEHTTDEWLYYASYSPEGDAVWVIETPINGTIPCPRCTTSASLLLQGKTIWFPPND